MLNKHHFTIYASSQYFGFGPTSHLFSILRALKGKFRHELRIKLVYNEGGKIFHNLCDDLVDEVVDNINPKDADLILSSFDPTAIIFGWLHDIPCIYYCNLFWFWDIKEKELELAKKRLINMKNGASAEAVVKEFDRIYTQDAHLAIFLGYLFATHCFIRRYPGIEGRLGLLGRQANVTLCTALMPNIQSNTIKEDFVFFQLSGSKNPLLSMKDYQVYLNVMLSLVYRLTYLFPKLHFIFCVNPKLIHLIPKNKNIDNVDIITSTSPENNLSLLSKAKAVFTSPGLETIFEGCYVHAPIFLLPEQNAGQYKNFYILQKTGYNPGRFIIDEEFPERKKSEGEDDIHNLYDTLRQMTRGRTDLMKQMEKRAFTFLQKISTDQERHTYLNMQSTMLFQYMEGYPFHHGEAIVNYVNTKMSQKTVADILPYIFLPSYLKHNVYEVQQ